MNEDFVKLFNETITKIKTENKGTKFNMNLFENKLYLDIPVIEMLFESVSKHMNSELDEDNINENLTKLYSIVMQIYESLDLKPYPYMFGKMNNVDEFRTIYLQEVQKSLIDDYVLIYEACKRNRNKKRQKRQKRRIKEKIITESNVDIDRIFESEELFEILNEFIDVIMFSGTNKIYIQRIDHLEETDLIVDKEYVKQLLNEYEEVKEKLIKSILK